MKEIPLTQGKVALVDDEDYEKFSKFKWYAHNNYGRTFYAMRAVPKPGGGRMKAHLHREIIGAKLGEFVDHIDGDGLNNQKSNLRICTKSENGRNSRKRADNASGFRGVCWDARKKKWLARIQIDEKCRFLGYFTDPAGAARARDRAAIELYGEFARLNFP